MLIGAWKYVTSAFFHPAPPTLNLWVELKPKKQKSVTTDTSLNCIFGRICLLEKEADWENVILELLISAVWLTWCCVSQQCWSTEIPPNKFYTTKLLWQVCGVSQLTWMQMSGQRMGRKGGQQDGWSPLSPAGRKEGETCLLSNS